MIVSIWEKQSHCRLYLHRLSASASIYMKNYYPWNWLNKQYIRYYDFRLVGIKSSNALIATKVHKPVMFSSKQKNTSKMIEKNIHMMQINSRIFFTIIVCIKNVGGANGERWCASQLHQALALLRIVLISAYEPNQWLIGLRSTMMFAQEGMRRMACSRHWLYLYSHEALLATFSLRISLSKFVLHYWQNVKELREEIWGQGGSRTR